MDLNNQIIKIGRYYFIILLLIAIVLPSVVFYKPTENSLTFGGFGQYSKDGTYNISIRELHSYFYVDGRPRSEIQIDNKASADSPILLYKFSAVFGSFPKMSVYNVSVTTMTISVGIAVFDSQGNLKHVEIVLFTFENQSTSLDAGYKFYWNKPTLSNVFDKNFMPIVTKNYLVVNSFVVSYYLANGSKIYQKPIGDFFFSLQNEHAYIISNNVSGLPYTLQTVPGNIQVTYRNSTALTIVIAGLGFGLFALTVTIIYVKNKTTNKKSG